MSFQRSFAGVFEISYDPEINQFSINHIGDSEPVTFKVNEEEEQDLERVRAYTMQPEGDVHLRVDFMCPECDNRHWMETDISFSEDGMSFTSEQVDGEDEEASYPENDMPVVLTITMDWKTSRMVLYIFASVVLLWFLQLAFEIIKHYTD